MEGVICGYMHPKYEIVKDKKDGFSSGCSPDASVEYRI
jgi:hypothetical protein